MRQYRFIKVFSLFIFLIAMEIFFLSDIEKHNKLSSEGINRIKNAPSLLVQGIQFHSFNGTELTVKIKAKKIMVKPRKFFAFNFKSINDINLQDVTIDFFRQNEDSCNLSLNELKSMAFSSPKKKKSASRALQFGETRTGLITRGVITNFVLNVHKNGVLYRVIKASTAHVDFKKNRAKLTDGTIEDMNSKEIIRSNSIVLKGNENILSVPGQYVILSSKGITRGKGLNLKL